MEEVKEEYRKAPCSWQAVATYFLIFGCQIWLWIRYFDFMTEPTTENYVYITFSLIFTPLTVWAHLCSVKSDPGYLAVDQEIPEDAPDGYMLCNKCQSRRYGV